MHNDAPQLVGACPASALPLLARWLPFSSLLKLPALSVHAPDLQQRQKGGYNEEHDKSAKTSARGSLTSARPLFQSVAKRECDKAGRARLTARARGRGPAAQALAGAHRISQCQADCRGEGHLPGLLWPSMAQRQGSGPMTRSVGSLPEGPGSMLTGLVGGKRGSGQGKRKEEDAKVRRLLFTTGLARPRRAGSQPAVLRQPI